MTGPLALGASLYVPATRPDLAAVAGGRKYPGLRSVVICTEDAVHPRDLPAALDNLAALLARPEPGGPKLFVRPRDPAVLRRVLLMVGARRLAGFVFPKVTRRNLADYAAAFGPDDPFQFMATLETAEAFDAAEMRALRDVLLTDPYRRRLLSLRIGGNDLLQLLGLRRPRRGTIHATPLGPVIAQLVATFRPHGINLTGPVYEYLDDPRGLAREARRDLAGGLFGKTAVHPAQVAVIEAEYKVTARELREAERVLDPEAAAVFRHDGAMCEPATHRRWAEAIAERARLYGVRARTGWVDPVTPTGGS
ncbi:HpcH/HpaI aldolase/citrate lyase family protein [bacterium]|nr:HpcH/HpaI aldolase/citrate lyase family protein [bacterium]